MPTDKSILQSNSISQSSVLFDRVEIIDLQRGLQVRAPDRSRGLSKRLQALRKAPPRGNINSFSKASRRRLRARLASARPSVDGPYKTLGLTLTIKDAPLLSDSGQLEPDYALLLRDRFHAFSIAMQRAFPTVGMIWRVELQRRRQAHWHIVAFVPLEVWRDYWRFSVAEPSSIDFHYWMTIKNRKVPFSRFLYVFYSQWLHQLDLIRSGMSRDVGVAECAVDLKVLNLQQAIGYLVEHASKAKQAQLGWQGRQWGCINQKALRFEKGVVRCHLDGLQVVWLKRLIRRYRRRRWVDAVRICKGDNRACPGKFYKGGLIGIKYRDLPIWNSLIDYCRASYGIRLFEDS